MWCVHCMLNKCNKQCFLFHTISAYVAYSFSFVKHIGIIIYFYNITILHTIVHTKLFIKYYFTNSDSICNVATACCQYKTDYTTLIWWEYQIDNEWNSCTISLIMDNLENSMLEKRWCPYNFPQDFMSRSRFNSFGPTQYVIWSYLILYIFQIWIKTSIKIDLHIT